MEGRERGVLLTIWLVIMLVSNAFMALIYFVAKDFLILFNPSLSPLVAIFFGFFGILNVIFTIFLFKWKKWAFYGFCGTTILSFLINIFTVGGIFSALGLAGPVITYLLLRRNWDLMD
jgi:hypothetical protein